MAELVKASTSGVLNEENVQSASEVDSQGDCAVESPDFLALKKEGNDLFQHEKYLEAIEKYQEARTHSKNNDQLAALLHNEGYSYEKMNNLEKALESYSEAVAKKEKYEKVLRRRAKLLLSMKRYQEALEDMVMILVQEFKTLPKDKKILDFANAKPSDFITPTSQLVMEIMMEATEQEAKEVLMKHKNVSAPVSVVETFLRTFYGDPVSRIWKGLDPSPVDQLIQDGAVDSLKGYMAALRDLKLKKYENIVQHCTEEIENPDGTEENIINAHFLRGTMTLMWCLSDETIEDLTKVTLSTVASNQMKSAAHLKLGMQHTNTRIPFGAPNTINISDSYGKAEELWLQNPDVYFHGSLFLVDRASPMAAVEMLELGMKLCDPSLSVLLKTFYWTLKLTIAQEESLQMAAYFELKKLEPQFDVPECFEMVAQVLMAMGGEEKKEEFNEYFDKAIALNPNDPNFKFKKLIFRHFLGEGHGVTVNIENQLEEIEKCIENEGATHLAYFHIGQMEVNRGNYEKGFEAFDKSIELSGSIHEIEARIVNKLESQFHKRVNERLKEDGIGDVEEQLKKMFASPAISS